MEGGITNLRITYPYISKFMQSEEVHARVSTLLPSRNKIVV
jgi:hypothetical protein